MSFNHSSAFRERRIIVEISQRNKQVTQSEGSKGFTKDVASELAFNLFGI